MFLKISALGPRLVSRVISLQKALNVKTNKHNQGPLWVSPLVSGGPFLVVLADSRPSAKRSLDAGIPQGSALHLSLL